MQAGAGLDQGIEFLSDQAATVGRLHAYPGGQNTAHLADEAAGRRAEKNGRVEGRVEISLAVSFCRGQNAPLWDLRSSFQDCCAIKHPKARGDSVCCRSVPRSLGRKASIIGAELLNG